jgi:hypothetical protein
MKDKYRNWIEENVPDYDSAYGKCKDMCLKMMKEFPELTIHRGWYQDPIIGDREHWWLKDEDNNIVDPTAHQFPTGGMFEYKDLTDVKEIPTGRCPNCGGYIYNGGDLCSVDCETEYTMYLNSGMYN